MKKLIINLFILLMHTACIEKALNIKFDDPVEPGISPRESFLLGGGTLTIRGPNFINGMSVKVGTKSCTPVTLVNHSTLSCPIPSFNAQGTADVVVIYPDGSELKLEDTLQYKKDGFTRIELFTGKLSFPGVSNAVGTSARFSFPTKPYEHNGYLYVSDTKNHVIRRINLASNVVEDFVGMKNNLGFVDGNGLNAKFNLPMGMVAVGDDIYVVDNGTCKIRKIDLVTREVTTIAGQNNACLTSFGSLGVNAPNGADASFHIIHSLTTDGDYLYLAGESSVIRKVSLTGSHAVETLLPTGHGIFYVMDILYLNNALYFIDNGPSAMSIRRLKLDVLPLTVELLAGGVNYDMQDGVGTAAMFSYMGGLATDGTDLFIADTSNNRLRKMDIATTEVTTLAGSSTAGNFDGPGTSARLHNPTGLHYSDGTLYFTSYGSHNVRKYNVGTTAVTTIAGNDQE